MATFGQYEDGDAVLDLDPATLPRRQFLPGQHGIARIAGGPQALIEALVDRIDPASIRLGAPVLNVGREGGALQVRCEEAVVYTNHVIVATPPRIATSIGWNGLLDKAVLDEMRATPTWMATQAKAVAVYSSPFWREAGLSGRAASRIGPMVEIHDHCGPEGEPAALFGFLGIPHDQRLEAGPALEAACLGQLERCYGPAAAAPVHFAIEDWAKRPYTTSPTDLATEPEHPRVRDAAMRSPHAANRIHLAGAETAATSPGLIEGAFVAAEHAADAVLRHERRS